MRCFSLFFGAARPSRTGRAARLAVPRAATLYNDLSMNEREHIIQLGRCLAAEATAGYGNAVSGGLDTFLAKWRAALPAAAEQPAVAAALIACPTTPR